MTPITIEFRARVIADSTGLTPGGTLHKRLIETAKRQLQEAVDAAAYEARQQAAEEYQDES